MIFFETVLVALFSSGRDDVVVCIVRLLTTNIFANLHMYQISSYHIFEG